MGKEAIALAQARNNIDVWTSEMDGEGLDAILVTASGCGTTIKDYGFMLRMDREYAEKAAKVSALARDVSEYLSGLTIAASGQTPALRVAYHPPCSLQHGQKIGRAPKDLLARAGFVIKEIPEAHLCCGSAGTYNMLQPSLSQRLGRRKAQNIDHIGPDVIASSNLGCMIQIGQFTAIPTVHLVELMDWATGGPVPEQLQGIAAARGITRVAEPAL
jgi:glycolate oxidase iron-sulfur subunit